MPQMSGQGFYNHPGEFVNKKSKSKKKTKKKKIPNTKRNQNNKVNRSKSVK